MIKVGFVEKYLEKFFLKVVTLKMNGIINMKVQINNFKFKFKRNKLIISEKKNKVITISFDEVNNVEKNEADDVIVIFNINEKIIFELNE